MGQRRLGRASATPPLRPHSPAADTDDGWLQRDRSPAGDLVPMPLQFENGIASLTEKLHAMGFRFGIYACASELTCGSRAGSLYHERHDAKTLAGWGVDCKVPGTFALVLPSRPRSPPAS